MTWLNPIAWLGLAAIAIPILVHLLARRTTRRLAFPTLRFIDPSRLTPARRRQLTDVPLLILRIAAVVTAVAALAQPWFATATRSASADSRRSRAIIIDTSPSMSRADADGRSGIDAARDAAAALAADDAVDAEKVIELDNSGSAFDAAAAWLGTQGGRRELVVLSDFAAATVSERELQRLDETIGLALRPVGTTPAESATATYRLGLITMTTTATAVNDETTVTWDAQPADDSAPGTLAIEAADDDARALRALADDVRQISPLTFAATGPIALVLPGAPDLAALIDTVRPIDEAWMFDVAIGLRQDPAVSAAARDAESVAGSDLPTGTMPVAATGSSELLVGAGVTTAGGQDRLTFFMRSGPTSDLTAAVLAALPATATGTAFRAAEPRRLSQAALDAWARPATPVALSPDEADGSDGRWLWLVVLALLIVESVLRRTTPAAERSTSEDTYARVA